MVHRATSSFLFFFNDTATTEIYTLSLHDALPISDGGIGCHDADPVLVYLAEPVGPPPHHGAHGRRRGARGVRDRKSTRLNSSHLVISYAVFCLKKKKNSDTAAVDVVGLEQTSFTH